MPTRKFHQASPEEKLVYKENSFNNIVLFSAIMGQWCIEFWITCGFLLGLHREGDMIKNDEDDIDINIDEKDMTFFLENIIPKLEEAGFEVGSRRRGPNNEISSLCLRKNESQIDIKAMYRKDDIAYLLMYENYDVTKDNRRVARKPRSFKAFVFPAKIFSEFDGIRWRGVGFSCPSNIEEYLVLRYGPNWRTPTLKFETWTDWRNQEQNPCLDLDFTNY